MVAVVDVRSQIGPCRSAADATRRRCAVPIRGMQSAEEGVGDVVVAGIEAMVRESQNCWTGSACIEWTSLAGYLRPLGILGDEARVDDEMRQSQDVEEPYAGVDSKGVHSEVSVVDVAEVVESCSHHPALDLVPVLIVVAAAVEQPTGSRTCSSSFDAARPDVAAAVEAAVTEIVDSQARFVVDAPASLVVAESE